MAISSFKQPGRISCFAIYKGKNGSFLTVLLVVAKPKYTPWYVFFTSATASNADSLICSVTHLATENYVLVQLLSLIINSINGRHNFLREKNNIRLSKFTKWSMNACCLLLPSTAICVLYLCWKSKLCRGEALKVLTQKMQLSHCFWCSTVAIAATARQTSDKSPFMHEADHKLLPSQLDFGSWAQTGT